MREVWKSWLIHFMFSDSFESFSTRLTEGMFEFSTCSTYQFRKSYCIILCYCIWVSIRFSHSTLEYNLDVWSCTLMQLHKNFYFVLCILIELPTRNLWKWRNICTYFNLLKPNSLTELLYYLSMYSTISVVVYIYFNLFLQKPFISHYR